MHIITERENKINYFLTSDSSGCNRIAFEKLFTPYGTKYFKYFVLLTRNIVSYKFVYNIVLSHNI